MRQKKSNWIFYVVGVLLLAAVGFVILHEVPMNVQHVVEEVQLNVNQHHN